jgi:hypothetical protein
MGPMVRPTLLASVVTVREVTVVGAGLAGLACARILAAAGLSVTVLESSDGVGGRVRSDHIDGWTLDRGFQILLTAYPELSRWYDLDALDLRTFMPGATIWCGDRLRSIGDPRRSPRDLPATVFGPIGSPLDRLRLLRLLVSVRRGSARDLLRRPDRSTAAELRDRGFSDRFVERFLRPLFSGIQLDPDLEVSSRRFEMILRMLAVGDSGVPADGMGTLSSLLADGLPAGVVRLDAPVVAIDGTAVHCASGDRVMADAVVVATDGPTATRLLGTPDPGSRPVAAVWFDTSTAPLEDRRILLDGAGSGPVANLAALTSVAPSYAPPGCTSAVAAIPGPAAMSPDLEHDVRRQLRSWGLGVDDWRTLRIDRIPHGQPSQVPPFHPRRAVRVSPGRYVCGDHRDTASIQGALFSGRRTADAVLSDLGVGVRTD